MPNNIRPGRAVDLIANKQLTHATPHYQAGLVGMVQKQDEPRQYDSLASRTLVANGIKYILILKGDAEVAVLGGATVGAPVYINTTDDTLTLTDTSSTVPFGRVSALPSTYGLPGTRMRVDMDLKDNTPNPS